MVKGGTTKQTCSVLAGAHYKSALAKPCKALGYIYSTLIQSIYKYFGTVRASCAAAPCAPSQGPSDSVQSGLKLMP